MNNIFRSFQSSVFHTVVFIFTLVLDSFVGAPKPTMDVPSVITEDQAVQFSGNCKDCKDAVKSWDWNFDEEGLAHGNAQQPIVAFQKPGRHVITLVINGDISQSVQVEITVKPKSELVPESVGPPEDKNKDLKMAIKLFSQHKELQVDALVATYLKDIDLKMQITVDAKPTTLESYIKQSRNSKETIKNIDFTVDPKTSAITGMDIKTN